MVAVIKKVVTVQRDGFVELRSGRLKAGVRAEITVRFPEPRKGGKSKNGAKTNGATKKPRTKTLKRLTKQDRGDIAESLRIMQAVREGREKLIPWEQVKREMGLQ